MTGVLDYGIGNIGSILNMIKKGRRAGRRRTDRGGAEPLRPADSAGRGRFDAGMALCAGAACAGRWTARWRRACQLLGICLGMQMLGRRSEEGPGEGLGYLPFDLSASGCRTSRN